jgi:Secretion system C-terminal sorting domain
MNNEVKIKGELTQNSTKLDLSNLSNGMYILKIQSQELVYILKIIKI